MGVFMNRVMLFTTTAMFALAAAGMSYAAGAHPTVVSTGNRIVRHGPSNNGSPCGTGTVLYQQDPTSTGRADSGIGIVSQNFETAFDQYDAQAADDFHVPPGGWTVNEVDVTGVYFNGSGPAVSETVTFYDTDNSRPGNGRPGTVINSYTVTGGDTFGSFCMTIPGSQPLPAGHFWVSVQANMDFSAGGEWAWENLVPPRVFRRTKWQNPGGGFATGPHCVHWKVENVCIPDGQGDHIFTLRQ